MPPHEDLVTSKNRSPAIPRFVAKLFDGKTAVGQNNFALLLAQSVAGDPVQSMGHDVLLVGC